VAQHHAVPLMGQVARDVAGQRGLAHAAFGIGHNDHRHSRLLVRMVLHQARLWRNRMTMGGACRSTRPRLTTGDPMSLSTSTTPSPTPQALIWRDRANALVAAQRIDGRALIDGQRVAALSGETFACHSPIDGRALTAVARSQAPDVEAAVKGARRAFDDGRWARRAPADRKRVLARFAEL